MLRFPFTSYGVVEILPHLRNALYVNWKRTLRLINCMITDSHCHIHDQDFPFATAEVFDNMREMGVARAICIGVDAENSQRAIDFCQQNKSNPQAIQLFACVGVHPHEAEKFDFAQDLPKLEAMLENQKVIGIGEIGLDYFYENSPRQIQQEVLKAQLRLAQKHNLPVSFHVRNAYADFWRVLDEVEADGTKIRGVLHSFTDSEENLAEALRRGFYIGVNGISTFVKEEHELEMFAQIPLEKTLLETDAPFLAPKGKRGRKNQPAWTALVAEDLAEKRGLSVEEIAKITEQNVNNLFNLGK